MIRRAFIHTLGGDRAGRRRAGFLRDESGGPTVEFVVIAVPMLSLFVFVTQVCISYFSLVSVQDAAHRAARIAATLPIAHCGALRNSENERSYELDEQRFADLPARGIDRACLNDPSPCLPMTGEWVCTAAAVEQGVCDDLAMRTIFDRANIPGVGVENLTVTYRDSRLGDVDGPVVPMITVEIQPSSIDLRNFFYDQLSDVPPVTASAVGEAVGRGKWEGPTC